MSSGFGIVEGIISSSVLGKPMPNVPVSANGVQTTTDNQGQYQLTVPVPLGGGKNVAVKATPPPNFHLIPLGYSTFYLSDGDAVTLDWDAIPLSGAIQGRVQDAVTGQPIVGAAINADSFTATSDASGRYRIGNVPSDIYTVTATATGYQDGEIDGVEVDPGLITEVDFSLSSSNLPPPPPLFTATIMGNVSDSDTGQPLMAKIIADGYMTQTDSSGNYFLQVAAPATYVVVATAPGYQAGFQSVTVEPNGQVEVDFKLVKAAPPPPTTGTLTGHVYALNGVALAQAMVQVGGQTTLTTGTGAYTLTNLAPGTYMATASKQNYSTQSEAVTIMADETTTVNFTLSPAQISPAAIGVGAVLAAVILGMFLRRR